MEPHEPAATPAPIWRQLTGAAISTPRPYGIMGILNVTPDSFYDGGRYTSLEAALGRARELLHSGADILDIGAESTRPGAAPVAAEEEIARLMPVLGEVHQKFPAALISVDTWRAATAAVALARGAACINDVSGLAWDAAMPEVLGHYKPAYVLMHSKGRPAVMQKAPAYADVVDEVCAFFDARLNELAKAGLPEDRVALDPGIGFGKSFDHNLEILDAIWRFKRFGRPVLVGLSMKTTIARLAAASGITRGEATARESVRAFKNGAFWHRVHDARAVSNALKEFCPASRGE